MKRAAIALERFSTRRMEALTDGVFAIAMTLLILDIKVENFGEITSSAALATTLFENSTAFVSFIVSFLLLGSMWAVHMRQFELITQTDRHLTMINTLRLLVVAFMPLTTSIGSAYPDVELARILLPLNFLLLTLVSTWEWQYAVRNKYLSANVPDIMKQEALKRNILIIVAAAIVCLLSLVVGLWAFLVFAVLPFLSLPGSLSYREKKQA